MRKTYNDVEFLYNPKDYSFCGVSLGWDFTAEHECGISGLERDFNIPIGRERDELLSLEAFKIRKCPEHLYFRIERHQAYLVSINYFQEPTIKDLRHWLPGNGDLVCAWDERSFGIRVLGEENINRLEHLYEEMKKCNVIIKVGGRQQLIGNSGLIIYIYDKIQQEAHDIYKESKLDQLELNRQSEAIGLKEELSSAGKRFYALSPAWCKNKEKSKYNVMYWLNPREQNKYEAGWYTVEELREWKEEKGPVIKFDRTQD